MLTSSRGRVIVAVLAVAAVMSAARLYAATITPQIGGSISQFDGGVSSQVAAAPPAVPCGTGVIDLSAGCSLPIMLGLVP